MRRRVFVRSLKVEEPSNKKPKKGDDKSAVAIVKKECDSRVVYHRALSHQNLQLFLGRTKKCWDQFDEYDSRGINTSQNSSPAKYSRYEVEGSGQIASQERSPRRCVEICQEYLLMEDKATFYSLNEEWVLPAASTITNEDR